MQFSDPEGAVMIRTSYVGFNSTVMAALVDTGGNILWNADSGIHRFKLLQIFPGVEICAFVTWPLVPDKVSEPLLVIVQSANGEMAIYPLWRWIDRHWALLAEVIGESSQIPLHSDSQ